MCLDTRRFPVRKSPPWNAARMRPWALQLIRGSEDRPGRAVPLFSWGLGGGAILNLPEAQLSRPWDAPPVEPCQIVPSAVLRQGSLVLPPEAISHPPCREAGGGKALPSGGCGIPSQGLGCGLECPSWSRCLFPGLTGPRESGTEVPKRSLSA